MSVDWAKLVAQGRAKAIGVPWSEEELKAVFELKIPPEYVRRGILTLKDYQKELEKEKKENITGKEKPLEEMKKTELLKKAKELGIKIADPNVTIKAEIIDLIKKAQKKVKK